MHILACTSFFSTSSKSASVRLESSLSFHPQFTALTPFSSPAEQSCLFAGRVFRLECQPHPISSPWRKPLPLRPCGYRVGEAFPDPQSLHVTGHRPALYHMQRNTVFHTCLLSAYTLPLLPDCSFKYTRCLVQNKHLILFL